MIVKTQQNGEVELVGKPLHVVVTRNGRIFHHPEDGTATVHEKLKAAGEYPYQHLYEGDNVSYIVEELNTED